ncbi:MAG: hypothetical protein EA398_02160 [Deltaproteobacteria bacterium]|nr:MAG: hypothetical protein EA398_02160 [Deltaproteobacteria bacterium]
MANLDLVLLRAPGVTVELRNALQRQGIDAEQLVEGTTVLAGEPGARVRAVAAILEAHGARVELRDAAPADDFFAEAPPRIPASPTGSFPVTPAPSRPRLSTGPIPIPQPLTRPGAFTPSGGSPMPTSRAAGGNTPRSGLQAIAPSRSRQHTPRPGTSPTVGGATPQGGLESVASARNPTPRGGIDAIGSRRPEQVTPLPAPAVDLDEWYAPPDVDEHSLPSQYAGGSSDLFGAPLGEEESSARTPASAPPSSARPLPEGVQKAPQADWLTGVGPSLVTQAIRPGQLAPPPPGAAPPSPEPASGALELEDRYEGPRWMASHIPQDGLANAMAGSREELHRGSATRSRPRPETARGASAGLELADDSGAAGWRSPDAASDRRRMAQDSGLELDAVRDDQVEQDEARRREALGRAPGPSASVGWAHADRAAGADLSPAPRRPTDITVARAVPRSTAPAQRAGSGSTGFHSNLAQSFLLPLRGPAFAWYLVIGLLTLGGGVVLVFGTFAGLLGLFVSLIVVAALLAINVQFFGTCLGGAAHDTGEPGPLPSFAGDFKANLLFPGLSMIVFAGILYAPAILVGMQAASTGSTPHIALVGFLLLGPLLYFPAGLALVAADGNPFALWDIPRGVTAIFRAPVHYAVALALGLVAGLIPAALASLLAGLADTLGHVVLIPVFILGLCGGTWAVGVSGALLGYITHDHPGIWD